MDSSGTVRWTNFTEDIRIRAKADEMLAAAKGVEVGGWMTSVFLRDLCG